MVAAAYRRQGHPRVLRLKIEKVEKPNSKIIYVSFRKTASNNFFFFIFSNIKGVTEVYRYFKRIQLQLQLQYITIFIPVSSCSEAFSTHLFQRGAQSTSIFGGRWGV